MTLPYLSIAEAALKTGRSPSTIRRVIRTVADDTRHPDRDGVLPSPAEVAAYKKKGENFTWTIREDVLTKVMKGALKDEKKSKKFPSTDTPQGIIQILSKELDLKTQQIEKQWEVIHSLNDRLREGNILMGSLQQRLTLSPAPASEKESEKVSVVEASTETVSSPSKESKVGAMHGAFVQDSKKPQKKGLFSWLRS